MKGLASVVSFVVLMLLLVSAVTVFFTYTVGSSVIQEKASVRQEALQKASTDYLRIDGASWDGNYLTVNFTALVGPVELDKVALFVNHVFVGYCSDLNCTDQTGNGFLVEGESGEVNIPYGGPCTVTVTLSYLGSTTSSSYDLCVWTCRRKITVSSSFSDTNYPVRIHLTSTNFDFTKTDGTDLRFYTETNTKLPYWVEYWTSGDAVVWVKTDVVSGDTNIYMYYCNPGATSESNGYNVFTWFSFDDTNLLAVFHFDEGSGTVTYDATGGYSGTLFGDANFTTGVFGYGVTLDGSGDYVETDYNLDLNEFTYLLWIDPRLQNAGTYPKPLYDGNWSRVIGLNDANSVFIQFGATAVYDGTLSGWSALAVRVSYLSGTQELFVNGSLAASGTASHTNKDVNLFFGSEGGFGNDFNGIIDEAILYGRLLSDAEINALSHGYFDHLTSVWVVRKRKDPEPSVTIGPEETGSWKLT